MHVKFVQSVAPVVVNENVYSSRFCVYAVGIYFDGFPLASSLTFVNHFLMAAWASLTFAAHTYFAQSENESIGQIFAVSMKLQGGHCLRNSIDKTNTN